LTTSTVTLFLGLLTWVALVSIGGTAALMIGSRFSKGARRGWARLRLTLGPSAVSIALGVAIIATLGSLYFSEVAHFIPCKLCWYQRIAMYPLVPILIVLLVRRQSSGRWYAAPLAATGAVISTYHYALQRMPALDTGACSADAACTVVWVNRFGFMTIPFMALAAFLLILTALLAWYPYTAEEAS